MKGKFLSIGAPFALLAVGVASILMVVFLSGGNSSEKLKTPGGNISTGGAVIQSPYGEDGSSIYGKVYERGAIGNSIPNATVRAVNRANGEIAVAQSAADGQYRIPVPSGEFMVSAEAEGYELSNVESVGVHSNALQDVELVPKGQAALPPGIGNPDGYVVRQGVHDEAGAKAVVVSYGYEVVGPITYTNVAGHGDIAYRDGQAVPTYDGDVSGYAWAVPVSTGFTIYVLEECGNITKLIVVETVVVMPPPPPPVVIVPSPVPQAPCCAPQPTDTPCPTTEPTKTPTSTPIPPTATPEASSTPIPTAIPNTPTNVPPTNTPVSPTPTNTPTFTVTPTATLTRVPPTVWGSIRVEPDSGYNQILNADIIAEVIGGTATGPINYFFDCTNDGVWEKQVFGVNETSYRAVDLCDYLVPNGDIPTVATIRIEREGESGGANAHVWVLPSQ